MATKWDIRWVILAIIILGTGIWTLVFGIKYHSRFYPGVSIGGESVGGKTYDEVLSIFSERAKQINQDGLKIFLKNPQETRGVGIPISTAGLTSDNIVDYFSLGDWEKTIVEAYSWGRTGSVIQKIKERLALAGGQGDFYFSTAIHESPLRSLLSRELKSFLAKTVPAQFYLKDQTIALSKEKIGERVDPDEVIGVLEKKLAAFDISPSSFKSKPDVPLATEKSLQPVLKLANELARSTNVNFYYQNRRWKVSGKTLATWLTLKTEKNVGIDNQKLAEFLSKTVVPLIDDPPRNSRFEVRQGKLVEILQGKSGNVVDIPKTVQKVEQLVSNVQKSFAVNKNLIAALAALGPQVDFNAQNGNLNILIETIQAEPQITKDTIDEYGIQDLVAVSKTNFEGGSSDRKRNIEVGVSKLNGLLIAPGEEFSTVLAIGTATEEQGFVKEFVIKEGKTIKELGGGLCQVATTLFRLALNAGLSITERTNHRYVISYYGPGLDATIYGPKPDFRFINDTNGYLLLQGKTKGDEVVLEFYGQKDGRQVEISKPKISDIIPAPETKYVLSEELPVGETRCSEQPRKGLTADTLYTVRYPNGNTETQNFHSVYQPWQKVCLVGAAR